MQTRLDELLVPRLQGISALGLKQFLDSWKLHRTLSRGALLAASTEPDEHLYIILEGAVRVVADIAGQEVTMALGYEGNCVFNMPSFIAGTPSPFVIEAIRKTELVGIHKRDLMAAVQLYPPVAEFWNNCILQLLMGAVEREVDLLTPSPAERVRRLQERSPALFQEIPLKYIAAYLRMSPETLSRNSKS